MPSKIILIEATPRRAADGVGETVRLAGGGGEHAYFYGGQHWRAGVVQLPTIGTSINFEGGEFGTGGVPQAAELQWAAARKSDLAAIANYFWIDAPITVRIGDENAAGVLPGVAISGKVLSATVDGGVVKLVLSDPAADLKKPLLTARFGGTGGVDGPAEWDGRIKNRVWGRVWNLEGELIDRANNIYCWADPARPLQAFDALRDKGAPAAAINVLAWQGSVAATFAALQAAVAPQGGGVACPSIACVKWWTQPAGALTADLRGEIGTGYVETTAQIVAAIVAAGPNTPFAAGTVAAAQAARPAPVGWVANDDSTSVASMIEELLGNSSLLWLLNAAGQIVIREWAWGVSAASATSQSVKRTSVLAPVGTQKLGFKRNETKMQRGDLAAVVLLGSVELPDGTPLGDVVADVAAAAAAADAKAVTADGKATTALGQIAALPTPTDGEDALSAYLTNEAAQLPAYSNGAVTSYAGASGQFRVFAGSSDISGAFALSTLANPQALTIAYTGQAYTVSGGFDAGEDTATVTIRATGSGAYAGVTFDKVFSLAKLRGGYEIATSLPSTNLFSGRMVFNDADKKLYRYTGTQWTSATDMSDLEGQLQYQQIGNGAVRLQHLWVTPNNLNPDPQFRDQSIWFQDDSSGATNDGYLDGTPSGWFTEEFANPQSLGVPAAVGYRWVQLYSGRAGMNNSAVYYLQYDVSKNAKIFVNAEQVLELKCGVYNGSNQNCVVTVQWFNTALSYLSDSPVVIPPNASGVFSTQITAPANASFGKVAIFNNGGSTFSGRIYVSNIIVRDTAGASMIVDGAIKAQHVEAGAITAAKMNVTTLDAITANVGTLTAGTIRNASDSFRVDVTNGRTITKTGAYMKVTGAPFGSSSQFIEWYGPLLTNLADCTEANAVYYLKTNGSAYFGGSLSAGILRSAIQTSSLASNASVETGPYGSNGGTIQVVLSFYAFSQSNVVVYNSSQTGAWNSAVSAWGATAVDGQVNASKSVGTGGTTTVLLERSINGGAFAGATTLTISGGTETIEGVAPVPGDQDGYISYTRTFGGSLTFTDPATVAQNRNYRATITARGTAILGYPINQQQLVSIASSEG